MKTAYTKNIIIGRVGTTPFNDGKNVIVIIENNIMDGEKEVKRCFTVITKGKLAKSVMLWITKGDLVIVEGKGGNDEINAKYVRRM